MLPVLPRTSQPPNKKKNLLSLFPPPRTSPSSSFSLRSSLSHSPTPAVLSYRWHPPSLTTPSDLSTLASVIINSISPTYLATNKPPFPLDQLLPNSLNKNRLISATMLFPINPVPHLPPVLIEAKIFSGNSPFPLKELPDSFSVLLTLPVITSP